MAQAEVNSITANVPQTITMSGEGFNKSGSGEGIWTVSSNGAFDISFSGTSQDDTGSPISYPQFSKQDVDASGSFVSNSYDHLVTSCGVVIDPGSGASGNTWGGGAVPTGTPQDLVKPLNEAGSPDYTIGKITPNAESTAQVHLYVKGASSQENQSGNYTMTVICTATANP